MQRFLTVYVIATPEVLISLHLDGIECEHTHSSGPSWHNPGRASKLYSMFSQPRLPLPLGAFEDLSSHLYCQSIDAGHGYLERLFLLGPLEHVPDNRHMFRRDARALYTPYKPCIRKLDR